MEKKLMSGIALTALNCILISLLGGCFCFDVPPDVDFVQQQFADNYEDIQTVVAFMTGTGYNDIYITDSSGAILADLVRIQVKDREVINAVVRLLDDGKYFDINKQGNTIFLLQWKGIRDIGCGIAYTINGSDLPEVQFTTELVPMDEEGWFYYVADYNEWRANKSVATQARESTETVLMKF